MNTVTNLQGLVPWNLITFLQIFHISTNRAALGSTHCGVLYSKEKFQGNQFILKDRDQSVNLQEDLLKPNWCSTQSLTVGTACEMHICNETYFNGQCLHLTGGSYNLPTLNISNIASAECTCENDCKCSDVYMPPLSCARAYFEGGCRKCHTRYQELLITPDSEDPDFYLEPLSNIEAVVVRKGCTLEVSDTFDKTFTNIVEGLSLTIDSYRCECDNDATVERPQRLQMTTLASRMLELPTTHQAAMKMLLTDEFLDHPGLRASLSSLQKNRIFRNVYILIIGSIDLDDEGGISRIPNIIKYLLGIPHVRNPGIGCGPSKITELKIPIFLSEVGISNAELRVVVAPALGDTRGPSEDARTLATLDKYLSQHEELSSKIPNVVLFLHRFNDHRYTEERSRFVTTLRSYEPFLGRITDQSFSNVVFVMSGFESETKHVRRNPQVKLAQFKSTIDKFGKFPKPTIIAVAENNAAESDLPKVDDNYLLSNNELYPDNLRRKLELVAKMTGDKLGLAMFKEVFQNRDYLNVTLATFPIVDRNDIKVGPYLEFLESTLNGTARERQCATFAVSKPLSRKVDLIREFVNAAKAKDEYEKFGDLVDSKLRKIAEANRTLADLIQRMITVKLNDEIGHLSNTGS